MRTSRPRSQATRINLVVSLLFHAGVITALVFLAAREGYLGKQLKTIAVTMAPKEKPPEPEKLKEEPKPADPVEPKPAPVETPTPTPAAPAPPPVAPPAAATVSAPPAAPPPVGLPAFSFADGAKAVDSTADPIQLYRGFVEFSLRSKWMRPEGLADSDFVAEVEVTVDAQGQVTDATWKKESGHAAWDRSVRDAVARTKALSRPPPKGFPERFLVRFDVVSEADLVGGLSLQ